MLELRLVQEFVQLLPSLTNMIRGPCSEDSNKYINNVGVWPHSHNKYDQLTWSSDSPQALPIYSYWTTSRVGYTMISHPLLNWKVRSSMTKWEVLWSKSPWSSILSIFKHHIDNNKSTVISKCDWQHLMVDIPWIESLSPATCKAALSARRRGQCCDFCVEAVVIMFRNKASIFWVTPFLKTTILVPLPQCCVSLRKLFGMSGSYFSIQTDIAT